MRHETGNAVKLVVLILSLILHVGCVGLYSNTANFMNPPEPGKEVVDMLKEYGIPVFTATVEDQEIYGYRVRDVRYIVLFGSYKGYDLIVVSRDGRVVETKKIQRPQALSLFTPVPWAVAD